MVEDYNSAYGTSFEAHASSTYIKKSNSHLFEVNKKKRAGLTVGWRRFESIEQAPKPHIYFEQS